MRFFRGFRSAVCWLFLLGTLGFWPCGWAAQLVVHESRAPVAGHAIGLSAAELQWVREHPRVIIASAQYPLYLFKDDQGQWSGLNNDVLNRISAMTGLQFVHEESFSTDQLLGRLESGAAGMSTTLAMNEERKTFLDFSHAFGGSGWALVGRAGAPLLHSLEQLSKRVLVLPTRHALEETIRRDYPSIELRSVKTYAESRALVESGEAYATIENETAAQLYPLGQLRVGLTVEGKWEADHLAVRKGQPQLLSILNKALEAFPPAELRALRLKWLDRIGPAPTPSTWQRVTQWGCWGMVVVSLFGMLSLLWNRRLAALIKQRHDAEKDLSDQLAFQHALIDAMPDPVFVRDLDGRLIMCNKSYEEGLSTRFDQVQGRQLIEVDLFPPETAHMLHAEFMAQLGTRKNRFSERQLMFNNGIRDIYQWTVPFYSADGQLRGLLGGWTDLGQRRALVGCRCTS
ncbi:MULTISPECIES: transporter substrate-binding domain-containing protein [unclassified Pseudomonas]|uniref:transporter substrate-binding domain-containing protein n=1 Tax=unclassified Pseudomonas TaxID=196821 RepID=UPI002AC923D9|nr:MULTISPECIES: transporter substrate-binding domain-containing protein [unclassified Pseudomonas]MEB0047395.1 transporter substrate-binding domain-containing protein [Pseudomonas sp. Dout3]MEB0094642.1 transporter substrate-binding domain-containing protein [Pseudomonas sp. DC1.2]WPX59989.1 transporter substrate-binding domain-containing protein [Pseudomonas sp. DC1.2]